MTVMRNLVFAAVLFLIAAGVATADPISYSAVREVGDGIVALSITTDGTIGVLRTGNLVDWVITVTRGDTFTIRGPHAGNNSEARIVGSAFSATATDLIFDFSASTPSLVLFQHPRVGLGGPFYCAQTSNFCFNLNRPAEGLKTTLNEVSSEFTATTQTGRVVIATADSTAPPPVPEPASMLLLGSGLLAVMIRRSWSRSAR